MDQYKAPASPYYNFLSSKKTWNKQPFKKQTPSIWELSSEHISSDNFPLQYWFSVLGLQMWLRPLGVQEHLGGARLGMTSLKSRMHSHLNFNWYLPEDWSTCENQIFHRNYSVGDLLYIENVMTGRNILAKSSQWYNMFLIYSTFTVSKS